MNVQAVYDDGLCMQCGTCAAVCPTRSVSLAWERRAGYRLTVDAETCTDCGRCRDACPGPGLDFGPAAWWRARNEGAACREFLGPWRALCFGWARDRETRHRGASGGVATALLRAALASGSVDAVVAVRMSAADPLEAQGVVCRSADEIEACRGSKYTVVAVNTVLRTILETPGRYAVVGLPCHVQGVRLARRRSRRLRERVTFVLGVFCGLTSEPRATTILARKAGLDPAELRHVSYRGPGWPGEMRLEDRQGRVRRRAYPDYYDREVAAFVPPRCRLCPDALAELADVSVGDAWLDRFEGSDGVSDIIVRTPSGERLLAAARSDLLLEPAGPEEMVASQREAYRVKREVCSGRLWLGSLGGRRMPDYPGLDLRASPSDRLRGFADMAEEALFRRLAAGRFPDQAPD